MMEVFNHKEKPEFRVILKKICNYKTGIYLRVDDNNEVMQRKKIMSHGFEEYSLVIRNSDLIKESLCV